MKSLKGVIDELVKPSILAPIVTSLNRQEREQAKFEDIFSRILAFKCRIVSVGLHLIVKRNEFLGNPIKFIS